MQSLDNVPTNCIFRKIWSKYVFFLHLRPYFSFPCSQIEGPIFVLSFFFKLHSTCFRVLLVQIQCLSVFFYSFDGAPALAMWITTTLKMHQVVCLHPMKIILQPKWIIAVNWSIKHHWSSDYQTVFYVATMSINLYWTITIIYAAIEIICPHHRHK